MNIQYFHIYMYKNLKCSILEDDKIGILKDCTVSGLSTISFNNFEITERTENLKIYLKPLYCICKNHAIFKNINDLRFFPRGDIFILDGLLVHWTPSGYDKIPVHEKLKKILIKNHYDINDLIRKGLAYPYKI